MSSGFRFSVAVSAEMAQVLYRQLEIKSMDAARNFEFRAAKMPENLCLNRWHNVLPYDATRVKMNPPFGGKLSGSTDYINASHVNVREANRCYILTQGPLKETIWHFWTMVYQVWFSRKITWNFDFLPAKVLTYSQHPKFGRLLTGNIR